MTNFAEYQSKRELILNGKINELYPKTLTELNPIFDKYFEKIKTDSNSDIESSVKSLNNEVNKHYSLLKSQQQNLINKIKSLKNKIMNNIKNNGILTNDVINDIKNEIYKIKQHKYYLIDKEAEFRIENNITPKTIHIPLEFKINYPITSNSICKVILNQNNGHTIFFKVLSDNNKKNNFLFFEIKINNLIRPLPVIWGITVCERNGNKAKYLNRKFTFPERNNKLMNSNSKGLSIIIAENVNNLDKILFIDYINSPNLATIKINVYLRYLTYLSVKDF